MSIKVKQVYQRNVRGVGDNEEFVEILLIKF